MKLPPPPPRSRAVDFPPSRRAQRQQQLSEAAAAVPAQVRGRSPALLKAGHPLSPPQNHSPKLLKACGCQHKLMGLPQRGGPLHPNGDSKLVCSDGCPISIKLTHNSTAVEVSASPLVQLEEDIPIPKEEQPGTGAHTCRAAPGSHCSVSPATERTNLRLLVTQKSLREEGAGERCC